jgi:hypothetical protein
MRALLSSIVRSTHRTGETYRFRKEKMMSDREDDYEVLAEVDNGYAYQWDVTALVQHKPTGKIFIYSDSGCSCNSPYEGVWWTDMQQVHQLSDVLQPGNDPDAVAFNTRALKLDWRLL